MFFLVFVLFTSLWLVRIVLDCCYFPLVSESASLSSNMHLCAKLKPYRLFFSFHGEQRHREAPSVSPKVRAGLLPRSEECTEHTRSIDRQHLGDWVLFLLPIEGEVGRGSSPCTPCLRGIIKYNHTGRQFFVCNNCYYCYHGFMSSLCFS